MRGEAHERALKAAETDATKRALATFGNRFGLALYDKEQNGVTPLKGAAPKSHALTGTQLTASAKSASDADRSGIRAGSEELASTHPGNVFALRDADGETLASALSGEGFCTGLRQRVEELEQLRIANADMLHLLRTERPSLKSSKGEHFADILVRLLAKKQRRLTEISEVTSPKTTMRPQEQRACSQRTDGLALPDTGPPQSDRPAAGVDTKTGVVTNGGGVANGGATGMSAPQHGTQSESEAKPDPVKMAVVPPPGQTIEPPAPGQAPEIRQRPSRIGAGASIDKSQLLIATTRRVRNKAHLIYVASGPCLICEGLPCHAHHLTFAQPRGLSVKVSDEFTVPLCAIHHNALHARGNERAFWRQHGIDPLIMARQLWLVTLSRG
jgi:hypothetical protein